MYSEPCARLIMSMRPNTSVSPAASRNSISPNWMPFSVCSRKSVRVMKQKRVRPAPHPLPVNLLCSSLHLAVFGPEVDVVVQHRADPLVDDAAFVVLDDLAHVVVLDRRAVGRRLPVAARGLDLRRRAHQRGAEGLLVFDLAFGALHRGVDDQRRGVALL